MAHIPQDFRKMLLGVEEEEPSLSFTVRVGVFNLGKFELKAKIKYSIENENVILINTTLTN